MTSESSPTADLHSSAGLEVEKDRLIDQQWREPALMLNHELVVLEWVEVDGCTCRLGLVR